MSNTPENEMKEMLDTIKQLVAEQELAVIAGELREGIEDLRTTLVLPLVVAGGLLVLSADPLERISGLLLFLAAPAIHLYTSIMIDIAEAVFIRGRIAGTCGDTGVSCAALVSARTVNFLLLLGAATVAIAAPGTTTLMANAFHIGPELAYYASIINTIVSLGAYTVHARIIQGYHIVAQRQLHTALMMKIEQL